MEKVLLAGLFKNEHKDDEINSVFMELDSLVNSAGGISKKIIYQKKEKQDKRFLLGKGKIEELKLALLDEKFDMLLFYNPLSNIQQRNIENYLNIKVIDRTRLILDIFALRARSLEGKLQVELAQLLYLLPRLTGKGIELSRLGGGIGTRGPGETKLEVDRRTINKRISIIKKKLIKVRKNRELQRKERKSDPAPVVSLVGYTSAGKSTLFNTLANENVFVTNQLFSTLDPLMRRVELEENGNGYYFLLSDTVGFIRDMPEEVLQSFQATLEEVMESDIILIVIDISDENHFSHKKEVYKVLHQMNIKNKKIIEVYNKTDKNEITGNFAAKIDPMAVSYSYVSAKNKTGINDLKKKIFNAYFSDFKKFNITFPAKDIKIDNIKKWAIVSKIKYEKNVVHLEVLSSNEKMLKFRSSIEGEKK
ncbi:MAG: GTPase HflX [Acidobacteriota bacterium]